MTEYQYVVKPAVRAIRDYFKLVWPNLCRTVDGKLRAPLYAVVNEGKKSYGLASRHKAQGLEKGIPDLVIPVVTNRYPGLYIEFKQPGKDLGIEQMHWFEYLSDQGYLCLMHDSAEEALNDVVEYMMEYKEK